MPPRSRNNGGRRRGRGGARGGGPTRQDTTPTQRDTTPARRETTPSPQDTTPAQRDTTPARRDTTPARRSTSPVRRGTSPARQDLTPAQRDPTPAQRDPTPAQRDPTPAQRDPKPAQRDSTPSDHITTVGVKRPGFGKAGKAFPIVVNFFPTTIPEGWIHHYDVILPPDLSRRFNMEIIKQLQNVVAPNIFTPRAAYDGRKNMFSVHDLPLGDTGSQEFDVSFAETDTQTGGRAPRVYKIRLTKVAQINPEVLARFVAGKQSHDNTVLTTITALNIVVRMEPNMKYPFNVRSFFTGRETRDIGSGLQLSRGYFQSVRPAIGRMMINIDISTGIMYKPGPLLDLCLQYLNKPHPDALAPRKGFPDRERLRLQRFISGIRILTTHSKGGGAVQHKPRVVKALSDAGANDLSFTLREGGNITVADYFKNSQNSPLKFPNVICVKLGSGALLPLELCTVPAGQIMRKQVPPEKTKDVVEFATKRPQDRLASIKAGREVLAYGQSEYVRQFGMVVDQDPLSSQARRLNAPTLKYGVGSRQPTITPKDGAWNMIDKCLFKPAEIPRWVVVVYERKQRFGDAAAQDMISGLVSSCKTVGIKVSDPAPIVKWENGQGRISEQLRNAGRECKAKTGAGPALIVVVLPDGGSDIYWAVKHFGDVAFGVATQCLKSSKCFRARMQYYANVCLKINVKLGGINSIPDPSSVSVLTDPHHPTIVMGADVVHPSPGSTGRPSFPSLVANVDSNTAKYIAISRAQTSRQEMIDDLQAMSKHALTMYMDYRKHVEKKVESAPKRIIFYRDGVSEGELRQVLELELPLLKRACAELKINPKITFIVVGKRHHVRFFPQNNKDADKSGNCPAGTIVDRDIAHPTEFDFFLQSHGGLLGTSRPGHYMVLYDDNKFSADSLQSLSFALCHVYARATRSVSIPAPVYYADIVCSRAKHHYDPEGKVNPSDSDTQIDASQADASLESFKRGFLPLSERQSKLMYFS